MLGWVARKSASSPCSDGRGPGLEVALLARRRRGWLSSIIVLLLWGLLVWSVSVLKRDSIKRYFENGKVKQRKYTELILILSKFLFKIKNILAIALVTKSLKNYFIIGISYPFNANICPHISRSKCGDMAKCHLSDNFRTSFKRITKSIP